MKKFTTEEIRDLLNQFSRGEISFSRMVEILNEMVSEGERIHEKPKKGDLAIFWDKEKELATILFYDRYSIGGHYDNRGWSWKNAIKYESKEQYRKLLKGEI